MGSEDEHRHMPARMLNEFTYCPRLFHLEWVQQEWAPSADTVAGTADHRRVDTERGDLPPPEDLAGHQGEVRSLLLHDDAEDLVARLDLVVFADGCTIPVDYKHGRAPEHGLWPADRMQVAAQALLLRANGYTCHEAAVYYVATKTRRSLRIDDALLDEVRETRRQALAVAEEAQPPPPLEDSPKCPRCSLVGICLPDESAALTSPEPRTEVRRLYPSRDDAKPLYVQSSGARIGKRGDRLRVVERDGKEHTSRLIDISQVCVFGKVQVSSDALALLMDKGIPLCHFSSGGWFRGISHGLGPRHCMARLHQYQTYRDDEARLAVARGLVARKIRNGRTLLRRNAEPRDENALKELKRCAARSETASTIAELLGIEGQAARAYFASFPSMLKGAAKASFDFTVRNRRPPRDEVNSLLSLLYSALSREWTVALMAVGLDPYLGFYHVPRHGRPALALDLMEEFRPLVADSVVVQVINNGEVRPDSFLRRGDAVALTPSGRRSVFLAYERRLAHEVRHPVFGYTVSYRRLFEVQARLFARYLSGELPSFEGFTTR